MDRFNPTRPHFWDESFEYISASTWNLWTAQKNAEAIFAAEQLLRSRDIPEGAIESTLDCLSDQLSDESVWQTEDASFNHIKQYRDERLNQLRKAAAQPQQEAA